MLGVLDGSQTMLQPRVAELVELLRQPGPGPSRAAQPQILEPLVSSSSVVQTAHVIQHLERHAVGSAEAPELSQKLRWRARCDAAELGRELEQAAGLESRAQAH